MTTTPTITTRDHLLWDILDHPDDDTPRLIYADWLEDYGDETDRIHARLIRTMIALEQHDEAYHIDLSASYDVHKKSAIPERQQAWDDLCLLNFKRPNPLDNWWSVYHGLTWRRGFVDEIKGTSAVLTDDILRDLFSKHPIRFVTVTDRKPAKDANGYNWLLQRATVSSLGMYPLAINARIPKPVWDCLDGGVLGKYCRWYRSETEALSALSAAYVSHGRNLACALRPTSL